MRMVCACGRSSKKRGNAHGMGKERAGLHYRMFPKFKSSLMLPMLADAAAR